MKTLFLFCLGGFSFAAFPFTLTDVQAAQGIQSTLQGTASANYSGAIDSAKRVARYKSPSQKYLNQLRGNESVAQRQFYDGGIASQKVSPVDYTKGTVVFYKKGCPELVKGSRYPSSTCNPGAVLTNIKSVIFDYAHRRGEFKNTEKQ